MGTSRPDVASYPFFMLKPIRQSQLHVSLQAFFCHSRNQQLQHNTPLAPSSLFSASPKRPQCTRQGNKRTRQREREILRGERVPVTAKRDKRDKGRKEKRKRRKATDGLDLSSELSNSVTTPVENVNIKLLLADDNLMNQMVMQKLLQVRRHDVSLFVSAFLISLLFSSFSLSFLFLPLFFSYRREAWLGGGQRRAQSTRDVSAVAQ